MVKSVLLATSSGYVLAVLPATHQLDFERLNVLLAGPVRLATLAEVTRLFPDCEVGVAPAFGSLYGLSTILDETIDRESVIIFEGHTHLHAIRMTCKNYERLERPRRLKFATPPAPAIAPTPAEAAAAEPAAAV